jgi:hypothetical protein
VELRKVLDLVRRVCRRRRILGLAALGRVLIGILLFVAVMSYRPSCDRSSNESSTPCPPPHSHGNSFPSLD